MKVNIGLAIIILPVAIGLIGYSLGESKRTQQAEGLDEFLNLAYSRTAVAVEYVENFDDTWSEVLEAPSDVHNPIKLGDVFSDFYDPPRREPFPIYIAMCGKEVGTMTCARVYLSPCRRASVDATSLFTVDLSCQGMAFSEPTKLYPIEDVSDFFTDYVVGEGNLDDFVSDNDIGSPWAEKYFPGNQMPSDWPSNAVLDARKKIPVFNIESTKSYSLADGMVSFNSEPIALIEETLSPTGDSVIRKSSLESDIVFQKISRGNGCIYFAISPSNDKDTRFLRMRCHDRFVSLASVKLEEGSVFTIAVVEIRE